MREKRERERVRVREEEEYVEGCSERKNSRHLLPTIIKGVRTINDKRLWRAMIGYCLKKKKKKISSESFIFFPFVSFHFYLVC